MLRIVYSNFSIFCAKKTEKRKKGTNWVQNLAKNGLFQFAPKRWLGVLFPGLVGFLLLNFQGVKYM